MKKLLAILAALTTNKSYAMGLTGLLAAATSDALGYDPLAWWIGGLGGAYICLRRDAVPRPHATADVMLSVLLGGVASPILYAIAAEYYPVLHKAPGQYIAAIALCFGWPWGIKLVMKLVSKKIEQQ